MAGKSEEFNNTIQTIEKVGTGVDNVGPENANLTEQVQSSTIKSDGKETNLVTNTGTGGGSGSGGGSAKFENSNIKNESDHEIMSLNIFILV